MTPKRVTVRLANYVSICIKGKKGRERKRERVKVSVLVKVEKERNIDDFGRHDEGKFGIKSEGRTCFKHIDVIRDNCGLLESLPIRISMIN